MKQLPNFEKFDNLCKEFSDLFAEMKKELTRIDKLYYGEQFAGEFELMSIDNPLANVKGKMVQMIQSGDFDSMSTFFRGKSLQHNQWGPSNPYPPQSDI